jgi:hypothetical protein
MSYISLWRCGEIASLSPFNLNKSFSLISRSHLPYRTIYSSNAFIKIDPFSRHVINWLSKRAHLDKPLSFKNNSLTFCSCNEVNIKKFESFIQSKDRCGAKQFFSSNVAVKSKLNNYDFSMSANSEIFVCKNSYKSRIDVVDSFEEYKKKHLLSSDLLTFDEYKDKHIAYKKLGEQKIKRAYDLYLRLCYNDYVERFFPPSNPLII